jgi:hypothetical protein
VLQESSKIIYTNVSAAAPPPRTTASSGDKLDQLKSTSPGCKNISFSLVLKHFGDEADYVFQAVCL